MEITKFYYYDNWHGTKRKFNTILAAKKSAAKETGMTITIHRVSDGETFTVKASGHTPS